MTGFILFSTYVSIETVSIETAQRREAAHAGDARHRTHGRDGCRDRPRDERSGRDAVDRGGAAVPRRPPAAGPARSGHRGRVRRRACRPLARHPSAKRRAPRRASRCAARRSCVAPGEPLGSAPDGECGTSRAARCRAARCRAARRSAGEQRPGRGRPPRPARRPARRPSRFARPRAVATVGRRWSGRADADPGTDVAPESDAGTDVDPDPDADARSDSDHPARANPRAGGPDPCAGRWLR